MESRIPGSAISSQLAARSLADGRRRVGGRRVERWHLAGWCDGVPRRRPSRF